jgi:hypothetical protein
LTGTARKPEIATAKKNRKMWRLGCLRPRGPPSGGQLTWPPVTRAESPEGCVATCVVTAPSLLKLFKSSIACRLGKNTRRGDVLPELSRSSSSRRIAPAQGSGNQSLCRWHLLRPECDEPERHVLGGNSSLLIWSTSQAVIRSRSQRRIWNRSLPADFSRKSALGIGRSSNIEVPAALGLLAARYVGNRPNPLCWNDPFPFQQGIEAIGCEVLERLNFPGRPADLQRLNLLCRP